MQAELKAEFPGVTTDLVPCDLLDDASVEAMIAAVSKHPLVVRSGLAALVLNASIYELSVLSSDGADNNNNKDQVEDKDQDKEQKRREADMRLFSTMHKVHVESSYRLVTGLLSPLKRAASKGLNEVSNVYMCLWLACISLLQTHHTIRTNTCTALPSPLTYTINNP